MTESLDDFDVSLGDDVIVRLRENGQSGPTVAKFEAVVVGLDDGLPASSQRVVLEAPWSNIAFNGTIKLHTDDADFEVVDDA